MARPPSPSLRIVCKRGHYILGDNAILEKRRDIAGYKDGLYRTCRKCANMRRRAWAARNREKVRAWDAERAPREEAQRAAARRRWYERNREYVNATALARDKADPERIRKRQQARRARKAAAFVEQVDHAVVWERDGGVCGICGLAADRSDWHLDHIVPLARGGEHSYANVQVAHPACNQRKGARVA